MIKHRTEVLLGVEVPDEFIIWLTNEVNDPVISLVYPWGIFKLYDDAQRKWLTTIQGIREKMQYETKEYHVAHTKLPRNSEAREQILADLVERHLIQHPYWQVIKDIEAMLELALTTNNIIECY